MATEQDLEAQLAAKAEAADTDDFDDFDETNKQELEEASKLLKDSAVLFEFLSNPDFCKSITKRERQIMERHITKIYEFTEQLDELVESLEDEVDE